MKRIALYLALAAALPAQLAGQVDPVERLHEVLPGEMAAQVMQRVQAAQARGLPTQAMANLALEGMAKGRSAEEVLGALEGLMSDMGRAQVALQSRNRNRHRVEGDVEAATAAMRMGVDGEAVAALAQSHSSGRSMAVPLLVMAGLRARGLTSDEALTAVRERLAAGAGDAELLSDFPGVAQGLTAGMGPRHRGPALAGGLAGYQIGVAGISVPVGPQGNRHGGRPRGGGPGGS